MKMRRYFVLLFFMAMMIVSATGCGRKNNGNPPFSDKTVKGQIIIGSTTQMSGDWETLWTNNGADSDVLQLISGYDTVAQTKDGEFIWDKTVVKLAIEKTNEDGSQTFTFVLNDGLYWNDSTEITAKDYLWFYAVFADKERAAAFGLSGNAGKDYVGHDAYYDGSMPVFTGLRLLGDRRFSVTVAAEKLPYYYDKLMVSLSPYPMHVWLPEGAELFDAGDGIYLGGNVTTEDIRETVKAARWNSENRVSCGPYSLKSYDKSAAMAVLEANPYYLGNYEGKRPKIAKIFYIKLESETQLDMLKTGEVDLISGMAEGVEINAALDMVEAGGFEAVSYERNGYGKLLFVCDFGPTQFVEVRRAIAYLLNREEFASQFCQGYGTVVNGPYGLAMPMYKAAKEELDRRLNAYSYSQEKAVEELERGGWIYGVDGKPYQSGLRYKEVSENEMSGYEDKIIRLSDGRKLMPLVIEWLSSENNPISELLDIMLVKGEAAAAAGIRINRTTVQFAELQNWVMRDVSQGVQYEIPTYNMFNLASDFSAYYDQSYQWTRDENLIAYGYNVQRLSDPELDRLSMDMVYGVAPGDEEEYQKIWVEYIARYNELLPELPLYSNTYYDVFRDKIRGYEVNSLWKAVDAILYCTVEE